MTWSEETLRQEAQKILDEKKPILQEKAELIALFLLHADLAVEKDDVLVCRLSHYDVLELHRLRRRKAQLLGREPEICDLAALLQETGTANPTLDHGHIGPDWDALMTLGIPGLIKRLYKAREANPQKRGFYDPCILVYEALAGCFVRWAEAAEAVGNGFVAENMRALAQGAPRTLAQAMQLTLVFYRLQMDLDVTVVRTLGGLDHLYQPFYQGTRQDRELIRTFLLKLNQQNAAANLPFYICDTQGRSWPFTWALLEEYRALGLFDPKLHVMYHPDLDKKLVLFVLDAIREGKSSYVFINTDVSRRALEHIGVTPEDAKRLTVYGCYEVAAEGTEIPCTCASYFNMAKAVELALNGGRDLRLDRQVGLQTGTEYKDFASFLDGVLLQLEDLLEKTMRVLSVNDRLLHPVAPSLFMSPTYESSVSRGLEVYAGGAKYNNTSVTGVGIATLVDSLLAVKQVVFERNLVTLSQLTQILKNDWQDADKLRLICKNAGEKYGNHSAEADALAAMLVNRAAGLVNGRPNGQGGVFRWGQFSVNIRSTFGEKCAATPDGRLAGQPLSKNAAASVGQDKRGVTALLASILALDASRIPDGCVADVVLHSSAVKGEDGLAAFEALLTTFMVGGGGSVHFNVLSPEVLRSAQAEPEKYRNLQIRLCGWNVRFVDLSKQEQDEFILQSGQESGL